MRTVVIIQARMGSSRLPGKVLMPLGDSVVLDYVVSRCERMQGVGRVIVATTALEQDNEIEEWCQKKGVTCFRGDENDVLLRYYECAKRYQPTYVIRVTADCPFLDFDLADRIMEQMRRVPTDILLIQGALPRGLVVEMISFTALETIERRSTEPYHREHVTYYAYEYAEQFKATTLVPPVYLQYPELRITLDTPEDYKLCQSIATYFRGNKLISSKEVIQYLLAHPEVAQINAHIEQKSVK